MNINEKCLLNYLSNYSDTTKTAFEATDCLINFLSLHNVKVEFKNLNPVYSIIEEMELASNIEL